MEDVLLVHVRDALQDLLHVVHAGELRVLKVVVNDALKQLTPSNTANHRGRGDERGDVFKYVSGGRFLIHISIPQLNGGE